MKIEICVLSFKMVYHMLSYSIIGRKQWPPQDAGIQTQQTLRYAISHDNTTIIIKKQ